MYEEYGWAECEVGSKDSSQQTLLPSDEGKSAEEEDGMGRKVEAGT